VTATTTRTAEITADPEIPAIRIVREFDAPAANVFRAHTDPELFAKWVGPKGYITDLQRWDCRTGGSWRFTIDTGSEKQSFHGSFHDVLEDSFTIVQTFTWDGMPEGVALERMVIEDLGDGRSRITGVSLCDSFAGRDAMLASGMDVGVNEGYEKLDALLAG
jgi:uncharacterized protein YndB with AHSA1/START domain